jgi:hypothetical protein
MFIFAIRQELCDIQIGLWGKLFYRTEFSTVRESEIFIFFYIFYFSAIFFIHLLFMFILN